MTEEQFFDELGKLPALGYKPRFLMGGQRVRLHYNGYCLCPIEAVYYAWTGHFRPFRPAAHWLFPETASLLTTAEAVALTDRIIHAADCNCDGPTCSSCHDRPTRLRLLSTLGLKETT